MTKQPTRPPPLDVGDDRKKATDLTLEEKIDALPDEDPIKEILEDLLKRIKAPPVPMGRRP